MFLCIERHVKTYIYIYLHIYVLIFILPFVGFDEKQLTYDGKSCLVLACEYNRPVLARELMSIGLDPNACDNTAMTCLQYACSHGSIPLVSELINYKADVNLPGFGGLYPLHGCVNSETEYIGNIIFSFT
jgi:ankyrin repeat protein